MYIYIYISGSFKVDPYKNYRAVCKMIALWATFRGFWAVILHAFRVQVWLFLGCPWHGSSSILAPYWGAFFLETPI